MDKNHQKNVGRANQIRLTESAAEDFELLHTGVDGHIVQAVPARANPNLPNFTVPVGLPPVFPSEEEHLHKLLTSVEKLDIHSTQRSAQSWRREMKPQNLYQFDPAPLQTTIVVDRNPTTGELIGIREDYALGSGLSARNSTSLQRAIEPGQSVRGSSTNMPFWPGGLEEPNLENLKGEANADDGEEKQLDWDNMNLLTCPPGMSAGMTDLPRGIPLQGFLQAPGDGNFKLQLKDIMAASDLDFDLDLGKEEEEVKVKEVTGKPTEQKSAADVAFDKVIKLEHVVVEDSGDLNAVRSAVGGGPKKEEWAIKVDVNSPVQEFHKQIPDMAYEWPFELDVFQKQAILHVENHDNVFVAAHTSAGKTVVAEYAIALSMKHMTRCIYTSPIKALSNQKFRDFKQTFEDVGLITGDVQLHQDASCLVMTTEILRSMLYNGSDVIRDLEWVIFDEVHYINDSERGVVWEEVLIMLPQHVNIILLSATVPNSMEFADWVGRIKKHHVYVVSTTKRPVPLEHYLYTGNSNKTTNELFLLQDAQKNFLTTGYQKALDAKKERTSKTAQSFGAKNRQSGHPSQDKNMWLSVIEMLRKKDKLPAVAFTFSKKRIEENANHLHSVDLTTSSEKSEIHVFFQKCISRLKGTDKQLPQVLHMFDLLKRGIGLHHSGVLPILKEVVEMLFQRGLVKILFATETFAMGVNMPARTVVFDTTRKYDGTCFRDLLPGEYIQMAGRAGRRGLDTTGTVILLCKGDIPEMADLHKMMVGKPTLLTSQFRITYSMILNLLRVEQLRVEDMMKRSFSEFHNQKDMSKHQEKLKQLSTEVQDLPQVYDFSGEIHKYYEACDEYWMLRTKLQQLVMSNPSALKTLTPGRIVLIDNNQYKNALGLILKASPMSARERSFITLMLCEQNPREKEESISSQLQDDNEKPCPVINRSLYYPEGACGHCMETLKTTDITDITTKVLKINADKIIDDIRKRQMPRFKSDPVGQSTSVATQELLRVVERNPDGLPTLDPVRDLHIRDMDIVEDFRRLDMLRDLLASFQCIHDPSFRENFQQVRSNAKKKQEFQQLKFLLSDESLQLLPEYQQRIEVLKKLQYIDDSCNVQLKGRVACEISSHEVLITELVLENTLTALHPTEIAALLSCTVLEQKNCSEPNLNPDLTKAKESFKAVARRVGEVQKECGLNIPVDEFIQGFKFGLMEVVFEWARGMPFAELTALTDVQEGIIVRCIQRLDEVLKDVRNAARIIGDPVLQSKMEETSRMIKRDIVFAASLYTQ